LLLLLIKALGIYKVSRTDFSGTRLTSTPPSTGAGRGREHHRDILASMPLADQYAAECAGYLRTVSDADLLNTARDYIWLAEFGPVEDRNTFSMRLDGVVNELGRGAWTGSLRLCGGNWERSG
jgi:hypothetical protein